jgi:hypothetical protein
MADEGLLLRREGEEMMTMMRKSKECECMRLRCGQRFVEWMCTT